MFARVGNVEFPEPDDQNVNMMPLIFGHNDSLPDDLQCYFHLIEQATSILEILKGKESFILKCLEWFSIGIGHPLSLQESSMDGEMQISSSIKGTSKVWDAQVDKIVPGIVDSHG
jgi:hypothetical protein